MSVTVLIVPVFAFAVLIREPLWQRFVVAGSVLTTATVFQMSMVDFDRFTEDALHVLWFSRQAVSEVGGPTITPEHVLIGLLRSRPESVRRFLGPMDSPDVIVTELVSSVRQFDRIPSDNNDVPLASNTDRVFQRAVDESGAQPGTRAVTPEHILLALLIASDGVAAATLRSHSITERDVRSYLQSRK